MNYTAYTLQGATVFVASGVTVNNNSTPSTGALVLPTNSVTIDSLFGVSAGVFTDANVGQSFKGVVVVANSTGYEWSANGTTWTSIGATSDSSSVFLTPTTLIRYNGSGTAPELTVRLVDSSGLTGTSALTNGQTGELLGHGALPWCDRNRVKR